MEAYALEWVALLVRWLHLVAAIAWVGTSFYFIALDYGLLPPLDPRDAARGVGGESWEVHGGGFYRVEKFKTAPEVIGEPLHWFKWDAYTTWLSGFTLLVVLYYFNANTYLIDRRVADLAAWQAIGISLAILAGGWLVYDGLCRVLEGRELLLAVALALVIALVAWGTSHLFSARAVYIQVGAMIGTWMVANVYFVIIPGHHEMVNAREAGREPDPRHGLIGKQRSVHNNYLTLPVLFAMMSNHFPTAYSHEHGWLVLVVIMLLAAWLRHYFNLRHLGRNAWPIPASAAAGIVLVALWIAPPGVFDSHATAQSGPVEFTTVQRIVVQRCTPCHASQPTYAAFTVAPKGITFDTADEIRTQAAIIHQQTVATRAMPLGNLTDMTAAERQQIAAWYARGAPAQ